MAKEKIKVYPAKEQGIKKPETSEEKEEAMEEGKEEETVYSEEGREKLAEDDEIKPFEEGFMEGAEGRGKKNSCAECGKQIEEDDENIVERKFGDEIKLFCSEEHAENYAKKHKNFKIGKEE
jgi:adenine-specific DNA methylase